MNPPTAAEGDAMTALRNCELSLRERAGVLAALASASREMRDRLQTDASADIRDLLDLRERKSLEYADMCARQAMSDDALVRGAKAAAAGDKGESAALGVSLLSLFAQAQDLAKEIMTCQAECEAILRTRLQATAKALRQSAQRRKLDAAYGPAHRHDVPVFMDHRK